MKYFRLEIYDGKPLKPINLEDDLSLEEQWFHLTEDITCIDYVVHDVLFFSVDVGYYPSVQITPNSYFKVIIMEGPYTDGGIFFDKRSKTLEQMKLDLTEAIALIQAFKQMAIHEILKKKIRDFN